MGCKDSDNLKSKLSLRQLKERVKRLEKKVERQNFPTQPKLSTSLRFLLHEARHWHNIGTLLEIPEPTLEQIETEYRGDPQECVKRNDQELAQASRPSSILEGPCRGCSSYQSMSCKEDLRLCHHVYHQVVIDCSLYS